MIWSIKSQVHFKSFEYWYQHNPICICKEQATMSILIFYPPITKILTCLETLPIYQVLVVKGFVASHGPPLSKPSPWSRMLKGIALRASSMENPRIQMQILIRTDKLVIAYYCHMTKMHESVIWMKLAHLLSHFFSLNIKGPFQTSPFTSKFSIACFNVHIEEKQHTSLTHTMLQYTPFCAHMSS